MTNHHIDRRIAAVAAEQGSKFARRQVWELGADDDFIDHRLDSGLWVLEAPGTYGYPGMKTDYEGRLWVGHLAIGTRSVVSHEAAAQIRCVNGFVKDQVVLSVPHGDHPRVAGVTVHQPRDIEQHQWTRVRGLPVMTVPWIFVDMAGVARGRTKRLGFALDDAVVARQTTYAEVGECLRAVARRGKPGVRTLTTVLDERGPGHVPPNSELERALFELLQIFGLPDPRRQYPFPGRELPTGCVDAAYLAARLVLEADGRRWHTRIQDLRRDHDRDHAATRSGWLVLRLLYEHIVGDPEGTARLIRDTLAVRGMVFS
jgi:very-short-patch-repair endonuclease